MNLEVVTPKGQAAVAEADEVTAPGVRGEFGVLPGHTPFVSALRPGVLTWKQKGGKKGVLAVGSGFAEVNGKDKVVVLTQYAASPDEIDAGETKRELEEADKALKEWKAPDPSVQGAASGPSREEIETRRAWAQARLDAKSAV